MNHPIKHATSVCLGSHRPSVSCREGGRQSSTMDRQEASGRKYRIYNLRATATTEWPFTDYDGSHCDVKLRNPAQCGHECCVSVPGESCRSCWSIATCDQWARPGHGVHKHPPRPHTATAWLVSLTTSEQTSRYIGSRLEIITTTSSVSCPSFVVSCFI